MKLFARLQQELVDYPKGHYSPEYFRYLGFLDAMTAPPAGFRAAGVYGLFTYTKPVILKSELIAGNTFSLFADTDALRVKHAENQLQLFKRRNFLTNGDHYAPNYRHTLAVGVPGLIAEVDASLETHKDDPKKVETLQSMRHTLCGFQQMIRNYAAAAERSKQDPTFDPNRLVSIAENCTAIAEGKPQTFAQALQLVWFCHLAFSMECRYAMALGRLDQYLYPFYKADVEAGRLTDAQVIEYLENVFIKLKGDIINICIGGQDVNGNCEVNELSRCILRAVNGCHVPGPNLSFRVTQNTPDEFLDECLQVIGTGLGYPALMNDEVHLAALKRYGYSDEDAHDYCMVGCIENFITGKQPPWNDQRFHSPRYLEYMFYNGVSYADNSFGPDPGNVENFTSMADFIAAFEKELAFGADDYCAWIHSYNNAINQDYYRDPFLSCFCDDCIGRGLDINNGGARYPSVHGACLMGIATIADSLAAIEKVVFIDKEATLADIRAAMQADFVGFEALQEKLLAAPKYGNNDDFVDKYAVWFVDFMDTCFAKHRTRDGGYFYLAAASNTDNITYGGKTGATPDGRKAGVPISDAASPTYGRDTRGPTASLASLAKPDYTKVACGTVVNQKYSPAMFNDQNRPKLMALIRTYFKLGGQEVQINSTSRAVLLDAMDHPENYQNLVVRVSGYSAFYVNLDRRIQQDILNRTQQG